MKRPLPTVSSTLWLPASHGGGEVEIRKFRQFTKRSSNYSVGGFDRTRHCLWRPRDQSALYAANYCSACWWKGNAFHDGRDSVADRLGSDSDDISQVLHIRH